MDYQTNFLRTETGEIYAIRRRVDHDKELVSIHIAAKCDNPDDAHDIVRQLNYRKELAEEATKQNRKLTARLLKAYRTNAKLRRELNTVQNYNFINNNSKSKG